MSTTFYTYQHLLVLNQGGALADPHRAGRKHARAGHCAKVGRWGTQPAERTEVTIMVRRPQGVG